MEQQHVGHVHVPVDPVEAAKHLSHPAYHQFLVFVLIFFLLASQAGLYVWKLKKYRSFQSATLIGLWVIPFLWSISVGFYRMLLFWCTFTIGTLILLRKASQSPLHRDTPKQVYGWFYFLYRVCYSSAVAGYFMVLADFTGFSTFIPIHLLLGVPFSYLGMMFIFYGLYYGVLSRDCAEMITDRVAVRMGFTGKGLPAKSLPPSTCCICGDQYKAMEESIKLNCSHQFHEWCIRGWTMIGKKQTCPFCGEKVENQLNTNPWAKQGVMWAHLLDALRYLIVWNPIILGGAQLFLYLAD